MKYLFLLFCLTLYSQEVILSAGISEYSIGQVWYIAPEGIQQLTIKPTVWITNWSEGTPDLSLDAIIDGDYTTTANGPITTNSLTVNSTRSLTINSGTNVTVQNEIINNGIIIVENNANLIQINDVLNTGEINVNRDSSPLLRLDYTMWSSPVKGAQTLGGFSPLTSTNRFYEYNTTSDLYNAVANTIPFDVAKGYLIRMPNTWISSPEPPTPWSGIFTGTPNNGNIKYTMSTALNGYNAVGNPYPSTISIANFISGNINNIDGTLYFWRKRNDATNLTSYSTCTSAGCTINNSHIYANSDFISVGQGFIVKATSTTLNFSNSMRLSNNQNQFFKTKAIEKNRIWLNLLKDNTPVNQMLVVYMTGATQGIDPAIDGKYFNDSQTALNSLIGSEEFAIQGRGLPFDVTDVVPLAFKTTTAGNFTIVIDHVDGLFDKGQDIYLVDSKTGTEANLKLAAYTFTAAVGVDNTRFSLKYLKTLKVIDSEFNDNSVTVYAKNGTLYVNSGASAISNIKVFDIQGRLIAEQKNVKSNTAAVANLKTNQALIVQVSSEDNTVVSKKVLN